MTKTELITEMNNKFHKVLTPDLKHEDSGIKYYIVGVYELFNDTLVRKNIGFYVEDEGGAGEAAYWLQNEPKVKTSVVTFGQEVVTYIADKITAGAIEGAFVTSSMGETAVGVAYVVSGSDVLEKKVFFDRNISGDIQHRVVT